MASSHINPTPLRIKGTAYVNKQGNAPVRFHALIPNTAEIDPPIWNIPSQFLGIEKDIDLQLGLCIGISTCSDILPTIRALHRQVIQTKLGRSNHIKAQIGVCGSLPAR